VVVRSSLAIALLVLAPAVIHGQEARTIARYGFNDGTIAIDVRGDSIIAVAAAQGDSATTVTLRPSDARAWVDSTRKIIARRAPRKSTEVVLQRSMIDDRENTGAAISLLRRAASDTTTFELLFSTSGFGKFPLALERREAVLFFSAMRRAVIATQPPPKPKAAKSAKAAKPAKAKTP
jgi:hypothetical protein